MLNCRLLIFLLIFFGFNPKLLAIPPREIAQQAKNYTVIIQGNNGAQTGVLLTEDKNRYWVLSCINTANTNFTQIIIDNQYYLNNSEILRFDKVSLILIPFSATKSYQMPSLGNSDLLTEGEQIYLAGFGQPISSQKNKFFIFSEGMVSSLFDQSHNFIFTYTGNLYPGMEGSPIFDNQGDLIGIYCPINNDKNNGTNWAIPINLVVEAAQKQGLNFGFSAFGSPPPSF